MTTQLTRASRSLVAFCLPSRWHLIHTIATSAGVIIQKLYFAAVNT